MPYQFIGFLFSQFQQFCLGHLLQWTYTVLLLMPNFSRTYYTLQVAIPENSLVIIDPFDGKNNVAGNVFRFAEIQ
jgi:hypothetical protein